MSPSPSDRLAEALVFEGALGVDVAAYRAALDLRASVKVVGLGGAAEMLETMAGERDVPWSAPLIPLVIPTQEMPWTP